jgi:DNA relaxase NicK
MIELTLSERPSSSETELHRYLNSSISILSELAMFLYGNHHYFDDRLNRIETQIEKIDRTGTTYFNYLNRRFDKDVSNRFDKVGQQFDEIIRDVKKIQNHDETIEQSNRMSRQSKTISPQLKRMSMQLKTMSITGLTK